LQTYLIDYVIERGRVPHILLKILGVDMVLGQNLKKMQSMCFIVVLSASFFQKNFLGGWGAGGSYVMPSYSPLIGQTRLTKYEIDFD
jgi:hypothetical protein